MHFIIGPCHFGQVPAKTRIEDALILRWSIHRSAVHCAATVSSRRRALNYFQYHYERRTYNASSKREECAIAIFGVAVVSAFAYLWDCATARATNAIYSRPITTSRAIKKMRVREGGTPDVQFRGKLHYLCPIIFGRSKLSAAPARRFEFSLGVLPHPRRLYSTFIFHATFVSPLVTFNSFFPNVFVLRLSLRVLHTPKPSNPTRNSKKKDMHISLHTSIQSAKQ